MYIYISLWVLTHCKYATNMPYRCNYAMIHKGLKMNSQPSVVRCFSLVSGKKSFTRSLIKGVSGSATAYAQLAGSFAAHIVEEDAPRRGFDREACVCISQDFSAKALAFYRRKVFLIVFLRLHPAY